MVVNRAPALALLLTACGSGGGLTSDRDAPFDLVGKTALWSVASDSDSESGTAMLLLTDDDGVSCAALEGKSLYGILESAFDGRGLAVYLAYDTWGDAAIEGDPWKGLFASGYMYQYAPEGGIDRMMMPIAYEGGFYHLVGGYYSSGSWIRLDETANGAVGELSTSWWWGTFDAQPCGAFTGYGYDTGDPYETGDSY